MASSFCARSVLSRCSTAPSRRLPAPWASWQWWSCSCWSACRRLDCLLLSGAVHVVKLTSRSPCDGQLRPQPAWTSARQALTSTLYGSSVYRLSPVSTALHRLLSRFTALAILLHVLSIEVLWSMRRLGYSFADDAALARDDAQDRGPIPLWTSLTSMRELLGSGEVLAAAFFVHVGLAMRSPVRLRWARRMAFHVAVPFLLLALLAYHGLSYLAPIVACAAVFIAPVLGRGIAYLWSTRRIHLSSVQVYSTTHPPQQTHPTGNTAPALLHVLLDCHTEQLQSPGLHDPLVEAQHRGSLRLEDSFEHLAPAARVGSGSVRSSAVSASSPAALWYPRHALALASTASLWCPSVSATDVRSFTALPGSLPGQYELFIKVHLHAPSAWTAPFVAAVRRQREEARSPRGGRGGGAENAAEMGFGLSSRVYTLAQLPYVLVAVPYFMLHADERPSLLAFPTPSSFLASGVDRSVLCVVCAGTGLSHALACLYETLAVRGESRAPRCHLHLHIAWAMRDSAALLMYLRTYRVVERLRGYVDRAALLARDVSVHVDVFLPPSGALTDQPTAADALRRRVSALPGRDSGRAEGSVFWARHAPAQRADDLPRRLALRARRRG